MFRSSKADDVNDAFSKPIVRRRFQATQGIQSTTPADDSVLPSVSDESSQSPLQVFSPPVSIPESEENNEQEQNALSSSDSEPEIQSQSSTSSLNRKFETSLTKLSPPKPKERNSRAYDFDDEDDEFNKQPVQKKMKEEPTEVVGNAKFIPKKEKKLVYNHKWTVDDKEEEEISALKPASVRASAAAPIPRVPSYRTANPKPSAPSGQGQSRQQSGRVRNVKDTNEILESGEYDDFKQDVFYTLSTLKEPGSANVKCLGTISLAKKCVRPDFRQFIKSQGMAGTLMKALVESPENKLFALSASTIIYLLFRDFNSIRIDAPTLKLISQLMRIEDLGPEGPDRTRILNMVWDVFEMYLKRQQSNGRKVTFEMVKENLSPSNLMLEALVFITNRCTKDDNFKTELLNLGILQFIVAKVEKMVNLIETETDSDFPLLILDRCFRTLEIVTMLHKKNQAFLISHRGSTLINSLAKFLSLIHEKTPNLEEEKAKKYMSCMALLAKVLINMSHENELCCSKLGSIDGFLVKCLTSFTYLAPKYADEEKKFDIYVMMSSLLTNMVVRCNVNRKQLIGIQIKVTTANGEIEEEETLDALAKLFVYHEAKAKTIDEDLDKELAFEEGIDEEEEGNGSDSDEGDGTRKDGRLDRKQIEDMGQDEVFSALQQVMNKANAHMEDSIFASYIALLIGCLLQQNEEHVDRVKSHLQDGNFVKMIDQLQRFLEFMQVALEKKTEGYSGCRAIEKIIEFLERID